ncbi:MAG: amidohydrolase family protein [Alphaproteobacteria bacterium]
MSARAAAAVAALALFFAALPAAAETVIIHAGTLLDVPGEAPKKNASIIVREGKIAEVRSGLVKKEAVEDAARIIDLSDRYVLPGLIDSHVHIQSELGPKTRLQTVVRSDSDWALWGAYYAKLTLEAGFTTVRDVGARSESGIFALRDAINAGRIPGPRLYASGRTITPTGGHAGIHGYREEVLKALATPAACNGVDDCRRAVRERVKNGADHIKITATGGVLSNTAAGTEQQFFDDELKAIVETAHSLGRKVTAHAHGKKGLEAALRAGVDSIEHGTYLDRDTVTLFKRTGAYLVPTVLAGKTVENYAREKDFFTPPVRKKALEVGPRMVNMLRIAHRGGVKVAFGTDTGVSAHGMNAQEFIYMIEAGMTPMEAIHAATVVAAEHLGQSALIGTIEKGKSADIIAVEGDPAKDIARLKTVGFVMKEGRVYKGP